MAVVSLVDKTTFAAGELDRALHARADLARYQTGVAALENMVVMVEGGLTRRPGTRFVGPLKTESEAGLPIPFEYSATDSYILVINGGAMRVYRNGGVVESSPGVPYELAVPFAAADLGSLRWTQSGNVLFVAWSGKPKVITRLGHASWTIADYVSTFGPLDVPNVDTARTLQASAQTGSGTLTANTATFAAGHVGSIWRLDESDLSAVPVFKGNETINAGDLRRNAGRVYYALNSASAGPNAPTHDEGDVSAGGGNVTWRYLHSGHGFVRITAFASATSVSYVALTYLPSTVVSTATYRWFEAAWSDVKGWPTQVRLHDNRVVWARSDTLWLSKIGDYYDFETTADDEGAVSARLTSPDGKLVDIQWLLNAGAIVLGARGSEWMVRGTDAFSPITTTTVRAVPDGSEGSCPHRPQLVDGGAVFIGRSRRRLHYASFDRIAEKIQVDELTLYARQILKGSAIDLGYARDPHRIVWINQSTGELTGITFRPDQQVTGWHRHPMTNGVVENFAVITSSDAAVSETWMIVRRTIGGATRRYLEVLQPFFIPADPDVPTATGAWFVDCGLSYSGAATTAISGLQHLAGQTVAIMADGIDHRMLPVEAGGTLTLDRAASSVVIGLPIRWRVKTLRFEAQLPAGGSSKGAAKRADSVYVERLYSAGGFVAVNGGTPEPLLLSGSRALATPQPLKTGGQRVQTDGPIEDFLEVEISGQDTYPFTLTGLSPHAQFMEAG